MALLACSCLKNLSCKQLDGQEGRRFNAQSLKRQAILLIQYFVLEFRHCPQGLPDTLAQGATACKKSGFVSV